MNFFSSSRCTCSPEGVVFMRVELGIRGHFGSFGLSQGTLQTFFEFVENLIFFFLELNFLLMFWLSFPFPSILLEAQEILWLRLVVVKPDFILEERKEECVQLHGIKQFWCFHARDDTLLYFLPKKRRRIGRGKGRVSVFPSKVSTDFGYLVSSFRLLAECLKSSLPL